MIFYILNLILASETTVNAIQNGKLDDVTDTVKDKGLTYLEKNPLMFCSKKPKKEMIMKVSLEIKNCGNKELDEQLKESIHIKIEELFNKQEWKKPYKFKGPGPELSVNWQDVQFDSKFVEYILYILTEIIEKKNKSTKVVNQSLCKDIGHLFNVLNVNKKDLFKNLKTNILVNKDTLKGFKADHILVHIDGISILDLNLRNEKVSINLSEIEQENDDCDAENSERLTSVDEPNTSHKTSLPKSELVIEKNNKKETKKEENTILNNDMNKKIGGPEILAMLEIKVRFKECNCLEKGVLNCLTNRRNPICK